MCMFVECLTSLNNLSALYLPKNKHLASLHPHLAFMTTIEAVNEVSMLLQSFTEGQIL